MAGTGEQRAARQLINSVREGRIDLRDFGQKHWIRAQDTVPGWFSRPFADVAAPGSRWRWRSPLLTVLLLLAVGALLYGVHVISGITFRLQSPTLLPWDYLKFAMMLLSVFLFLLAAPRLKSDVEEDPQEQEAALHDAAVFQQRVRERMEE